MMKAALVHLLPGIDSAKQESFLSVLEARSVVNNTYDAPGWDAHLLNEQMLEMLETDCAHTAELIEKEGFYRWSEEHKQSLKIVADSITDFTYLLALYYSMMASQDQVCRKNNLMEKGASKLKNAVKKAFSSENNLGLDSEVVVDDIITDGSHLENGKLKPNVKYKTGEHEYIYETNEEGLIVNASADDLQLKVHEGRLEHNPNTYGKEVGDHAGHVFGDRFGGSPELDNLVSQTQKVNLSEYKMIENQWANALENGQKVTVNINIYYDKGSVRPTLFDVSYTIDDVPFFQVINN